MITVLANGCFDVLHAGHVLHLEAAAKLGDRLVVSLTLDEHVNKGPHRPINDWDSRALVLRALRCVSEVVPSTDGAEAVMTFRPDVAVKGIDYKDTQVIERMRAACALVGAKLVFTETPKMSFSDKLAALLSSGVGDGDYGVE
ncbi:MAG: adenylyltransferase/cytidyltransferase family protein [Gallionella sp.]|nr:adenylyltransferase/cytidyltransferase family protein [Gallionella sp.]